MGAVTRSVPPELEESYRTLRHMPVFDGVGSDDLLEGLLNGDLAVKTFYRDELVAWPKQVASEGPRIHLVRSGYVVLGLFDVEVLAQETAWTLETDADEKKKKVRSNGPMIRRSEKNLASFGEGELYNTQALVAAGEERCGFYASRPSDVVSMTQDVASALGQRYPFFAARMNRAVDIVRTRLSGIEGVRQEVFDFFIRHGLSVAETLRVRQVDRCIECKECEIACEERYGHKRLSIFGPRLGMLDFIYTCRTCEDQRCIDPCNFDSIKFDTEKREVLINESTCTGCAACAVACPYGAIEMVSMDDPTKVSLKARLENAGSLAHGAGTGRVAKLEKIASKCDHCAEYGDQACVSHCPTGALIEMTPMDIFRLEHEPVARAAHAGYDKAVTIPVDEMLPIEQFKVGLNIRDFADAKVPRQKLSPAIIWGLGLGSFFLCLTEVMLRLFSPENSLQYYMLRLDGLEPSIARMKVQFRPGGDFAVNMGYVGTALMGVAMLYPLRKASRTLQKLSTAMSWFDFHMMGGVVGPMFIVLHSALRLDNWVSAAFWSMVIVVVSGLVGRYVMVQLPSLVGSKDLIELELEKQLTNIRRTLPALVRELEPDLERFRRELAQRAEGLNAAGALALSMFDDCKRPGRWMKRRMRLRGMGTAAQRRELSGVIGELMLSERRRTLLPPVHQVLYAWKKVHVWFTLLAAVLIAAHVTVALMFSM